MAEIIINKERRECPPAVVAYIKELRKENARLEELYQKSVGVIAATDCEECKNKVYRKAYNDVMNIRANIQEIIEDVRKNNGDAEPVKHGHWIDTPLDRYKKFESKCSECGWHGISNYDSYVDIYEFEYCPYCGAKMDGEEQ